MRESFSELFPRRRIGRYEIVDRLGAGGMAEVLLAVRQGAVGFKKAVALKRILPQYARETQFVQMLAREAAIAAMLHHPNCVQVTELEEDDGELFMAMELLYGVTLDELGELALKRGSRIPLGAAVRIATDAARALHYVHGLRDESGSPLGVVHRDVSPQNLFVTEDGITKVLDFGIATAVEVLDGDTRTGALKGKYLYMAPEQVNFQPIDGRTDVWGLAVTLWGMVVGRPLFRDGGLLEALETIRSGAIHPPSKFRSDVPRALDEVVLAALQRAPEQRTPTADAFALALEGVASELPSSSAQDVAALVTTLGNERIQYLRARAAAVLRVSEQIADASGAYRVSDSSRKMVAVRRPDTLPEPNDAHFAQTAVAQPVPTAVALVPGAPQGGGSPITSVERPGRPGLGPPTLRDDGPIGDELRVHIESHGPAAMAIADLRPPTGRNEETLTTPSKPIALGAIAFPEAVPGRSGGSEARDAPRRSEDAASYAGVAGGSEEPGREIVESTDPMVRSSREPAAALGRTVVPVVAAPAVRSVTPSRRAVTPVSAGPLRTPTSGPGAQTATLGSRLVAGRARHPWWLDVIAIGIGVGIAWAVAEVLAR